MAIQLTIMSIDFDSFEEPVTKVFHKSEVTLGSDDANDIVLDRSEISRSHAKILCKVNGNGHTPSLYITDLGSTNGTLVERDSIRPGVEIPLKNHQRVVIGSYLIKPIFVPDAEKVASPEVDVEDSFEEEEELPSMDAIPAQPAAGSIAAMAAQKKTVDPVPPPAPPAAVAAPVAPEASIFEKEKEAVRETPAQPVRAAKPTQESSQHKQELERLERASASAPMQPSPSAKPVLHVPSAIRIRLDRNVEDVKIVAKKLVTLRGVIHYSGGAVPGVKVNAGKYGETTSGADGSFQIKGIIEGDQVSVTFVQEGFRIRDYNGVVVSDVPVTIEAVKLHNLRGRIVHKGAGLSGVTVDGGPVGKTISGPDGTFEFPNVIAGTEYSFNVSKDRFQIDGNSVKGSVTQDLDLKFTARELFTISGHVIHNGSPMAGVEVECINFGKTVTDSAGKYVFENVPEGEEYAIVAHKEGFAFNGE